MRPPFPLRTIRTRVPRPKRSFSSAARVWTSVGAGVTGCGKPPVTPVSFLTSASFPGRTGRGQRPLAPRLAVPRRLQAEQRPGVPHRERPSRDARPHFGGQVEQADVVGDRRTVFADRGRHLVLGEVRLVGQAFVGSRFVDGVQVLALNVSTTASSSSLSSGTSRTTTGMRNHPARCAARHLRSPATISYAPGASCRTKIGWMTPLAVIERASSSSFGSSTSPLG